MMLKHKWRAVCVPDHKRSQYKTSVDCQRASRKYPNQSKSCTNWREADVTATAAAAAAIAARGVLRPHGVANLDPRSGALLQTQLGLQQTDCVLVVPNVSPRASAYIHALTHSHTRTRSHALTRSTHAHTSEDEASSALGFTWLSKDPRRAPTRRSRSVAPAVL